MLTKTAYMVATAHLDTVWRWTIADTVEKFIPDTLSKNFDLIEKYPNYMFNFEGAYRYELIEEYYPRAFDQIRRYVKTNRWNPAGAEYENGDGYTDFEDTDYYSSYLESSSSYNDDWDGDNGGDWDYGGNWDAGDTNWDTDW